MLRLILISTAALAMTVGCRPRQEPVEAPAAPAPPAAAVTPADAGAPLKYESRTPFANVLLTLPDSVKAQPDLHARLYSNGVRSLREFTEGAQADRTEFEGDMDLPPYEKTIAWEGAGETGKLLSLGRTDVDFTGGAHPNTTFGAVIWDKALKRIVEPAQLFRRGADLTALDRALCAAVNVAKKGRDAIATPVSLGDEEGAACPRAAETPFTLAPSNQPGKAGGLVFWIAPYLVGPYAEGAYRIVVPQSAFRALLNPAYADDFAGDPPRTGDVTPRG